VKSIISTGAGLKANFIISPGLYNGTVSTLFYCLFPCLLYPNPMFPLGPASSSTSRRRASRTEAWSHVAVAALSPTHRPYPVL